MFKKSIILGVFLASNIASASTQSCVEAYENAAKSVYNEKSNSGWSISTTGALIGATAGDNPLKMKKLRISNRGSAITGTGIVAGVATTIRGVVLQDQLNQMANLLREAQVSKGLYLNKITKEVQKLQGTGSKRVGTLEVAEIIRNLDESGVLCQSSEVVTSDGIVELIDVDLNNK